MLQTPRLVLRRWCPADREPFARLNANAEVMQYFPSPLSRKESDALIDRIEAHHTIHGFGLWAVEERLTHDFIGFVGLNVPSFEAHFTPTVEVGWRLAQTFWGKGYATEAARASIQHGFETLGLSEIVSFTAKINTRSIAVMQRLGMSHQATDDFDHPNLPTDHILQRHVLYRLAQSTAVEH